MKKLLLSATIIIAVLMVNSCRVCPEKGCLSFFKSERVTFTGFNFNQNDTIKVVRFQKGDTTNALDTSTALVQSADISPADEQTVVIPAIKQGNDWKVITPGGREFTITDINTVKAQCEECKDEHTFFEEFEFKVNGQVQRGGVSIKK